MTDPHKPAKSASDLGSRTGGAAKFVHFLCHAATEAERVGPAAGHRHPQGPLRGGAASPGEHLGGDPRESPQQAAADVSPRTRCGG